MTKCEFFVFAQVVHVDVAIGLHPVFVGFYGERAHEAQAALGIGKDAYDVGSAASLMQSEPKN